MISAIIYGRNDSHGYNLHKRAAISLNCLGEALDDPDDEILFVDCNTPDALPTFPEAIGDTLTEKARRLLRIIRIRPAQYEGARRGSPLAAWEVLCRNVAARRSNPRNRWLLSTNSDMVFVSRESGRSLSGVASGLPDGFHQGPRFDVPEWLWEGLDRLDARGVIERLREWGPRFHLNEVDFHDPEVGFDSPGDFQLILREQLFAIDGFDENMILGWHVDANINKRLYLLNGRTESLLPRFFAYHCNHNLQANALHAGLLPKNDIRRFLHDVADPRVPGQRDSWGMAGKTLEEIRMPSPRFGAFVRASEAALPGQAAPTTDFYSGKDSFNENFLYDTAHVFPFVANFLAGLAPGARIGYLGCNPEMLRLLGRFLAAGGYRATVHPEERMFRKIPAASGAPDPAIAPWGIDRLCREADLFLVDGGMSGCPARDSGRGYRLPVDGPELADKTSAMDAMISELAAMEAALCAMGRISPRRFVFIGLQHTSLEARINGMFDSMVGGFGCHVSYGFVSSALTDQAKRMLPGAERTPPGSAVPSGDAGGTDPKTRAAVAAPRDIPRPGGDWAPGNKLGFNVIGYASSNTGLAVALRGTVALLERHGHPVRVVDVDVGLGRSGKDHSLSRLYASPDNPTPHEVNVFHMNPYEIGMLLQQSLPRGFRFDDRLNVCVPFWELSRIPGNWISVLERMDLVLAPTRFIQDALASRLERTAIRYYPQAVRIPEGIRGDRAEWGLPEDALVFGFCFDFTSVPARKNPNGVVQAFFDAFPGRTDVRLVIKMNHSDTIPMYKEMAERYKQFAAQNPNVVIVDANLPYGRVLSLMACFDVYVSLHRAEGLGLGLMESMWMGKTVMATAWSGNMEFMHDANSALVGYSLVDVDPNSSYIHCLGGEKHPWAEPDLAEASSWMRRLADDPALRRRLAERGRRDIRAYAENAEQGDILEQVRNFHDQWRYRKGGRRPADAGPARSSFRGEAGVRVLFQNRGSAGMAPGGDTIVMDKLAAHLRDLGVQVDVNHDPNADLGRYDLVHLFNLILPGTVEPLARNAARQGVPYVIHAFQENQARYAAKSVAMAKIMEAYLLKGQDRRLLPPLLELVAQAPAFNSDTSAFVASGAEAVFCCGEEEAAYVRQLHPSARTVVNRYGSSVLDQGDAGPELFEREYGVKDFVLCVGRLEPRKNQLLLLSALEDLDIPVVLAGGGICYSPDYAILCRNFRRKGKTIITERLTPQMLVSAYRSAKVHCLPSWYELPGLVTLEAARYGCNLAATAWGGIREYLGPECEYFEPDDPAAAREAVLRALEKPRTGGAGLAVEKFTWRRTAEEVLETYRRILGGRRDAGPSAETGNGSGQTAVQTQK